MANFVLSAYYRAPRTHTVFPFREPVYSFEANPRYINSDVNIYIYIS